MFRIGKTLYRLGLRLQEMRFLNRRIVFAIDLLLTGFASLAVFSILYRVMPALMSNISVYLLVGGSMALGAGLLYLFRVYRIIIRHSTIRDLTTFFYVAGIKSMLLGGVCLLCMKSLSWEGMVLFVVFDATLTAFLLLMFRSFLASLYYSILAYGSHRNRHYKRVLIFGVEEESIQLALGLKSQQGISYTPVGLLDIAVFRQKMRINNFSVIQLIDKKVFEEYVNLHQIDGIVFSSEAKLQSEATRLVEWCLSLGVDMFVVPMIEPTSGEVRKHLREVNIEDLLGRDSISIELDRIRSVVSDKCLFVSGAAGSIGSEIVRQLCKLGVRKLVCYDNGETPLHNLELEIRASYPALDVEFILGDVRSSKRIGAVFARTCPQIVYHAAAYKHVPMIERNPCEAVLVNVLGTKNMAEMAVEYGVERFVMISTDKAVRPTNVMGASKRLAEMFVQAMNFSSDCSTRFITTRFGNVLGSNGSVIPLFKDQIANGGPVTVTHPDIVRYFMTIPEACRLVLQASVMGSGGEIFVFDMGDPVRIVDLAKRMIQLAGLREGRDIAIQYTGLRPGEKLYEELLTEEESTTETQHGKIRKAVVTPSSLETLDAEITELIRLSQLFEIDPSVILLKQLVPDFISQNSRFEKMDEKD